MLRLGGVVGILVVAALQAPVSAVVNSGIPLLVSGSPYSAIVDANKNGQIGDNGDCMFMSSMGEGLYIEGMQAITATNRLRACIGFCLGSGFISSGFGEVMIEGCEWERSPHQPWVPAVVGFGPTLPSMTMPTGVSQSVTQQQPLEVKAARLFYPLMGAGEEPGFGSLCDAGGPAVQATLMGGAMVVRDIKFVGDGQPFACVNMPFELNQGGFDLFDACVPATRFRTIEVTAGDDPDPLAIARLAALPACGTTAAPAATELGLISLAVALLGVGAWALGRRRTFFDSLPLL